MSLTVLTGVSGSGKSRHLIEEVNRARAAGRTVHTVVSSDYPWPSNHGALWVHHTIVCREPGITTRLDHFVSGREMSELLATVSPGVLVAVDDAFAFGPDAADVWLAASERGVDVLVAAPSYEQERRMQEVATFESKTLLCQVCGQREASIPTIDDETGGTRSLCRACFDEASLAARSTIADLLRATDPYEGEDGLYQPVEIDETAGWRLARPDTLRRAAAVHGMAADLGVIGRPGEEMPRYLDVGCNTGTFCDYFASRGFRAKGVDATMAFIRVARMMDSFVRRQRRPGQQFVTYERRGAYEYLRDTQDERFEVTSSYATMQWVMMQRSVEDGLQCIEWLANKTEVVCFIEFGYTSEDLYRDKLGVDIDRAWVVDAMRSRGSFADVRVIERAEADLQREIFVGIR